MTPTWPKKWSPRCVVSVAAYLFVIIVSANDTQLNEKTAKGLKLAPTMAGKGITAVQRAIQDPPPSREMSEANPAAW
jgi:hypothetical protein